MLALVLTPWVCVCCVRSLPGSVAERQLLKSFSHMLPELRTLRASLHAMPYTMVCLHRSDPCPACVYSVRFSSASHLLSKISDEMQAHHRVNHAVHNAPATTETTAVSSRVLGRAGRLLQQAHLAPPPSLPRAQEHGSIWDGWSSAQPVDNNPFNTFDDDGGEDLDLNALGL